MDINHRTQVIEKLNHVALTNFAMLIRHTEYENIVKFQPYVAELQKDLKLLSEVSLCLHFAWPEHPLTRPLFERLRRILLHPYTLQTVRLNPLLANWLLSSVALFQYHYVVTRERDLALAMVDHFGLHTLDAPSYRSEENRYLFAKLKGEMYTPVIDRTFERNFYHLTRNQVYALTHLLFYLSDYGTLRYSCAPELRFALEHLAYDAYLSEDVDVMLELMLVYQAAEQSDDELVALFEALLVKLIGRSAELRHAMTEIHSEHFRHYYHQCLLAVMYCSATMRMNHKPFPVRVETYRAMRITHRFHMSLRSANYVKAAQKFTGLSGLNSARMKFCRNNLDHYLALQRHDLGMPVE